ncbi:DUF4760 domain-containing protein [Streptomyces sp. NPDC001070]
MSVWDATAAVSGAFGAVIVTVACGYAAAQVREARQARALQSLIAVHQEYQAPALRRIRRRIRDGELADFDALSAEDRDGLDDLMQKLELVAFLVSRRLVDLDDAIQLFPSVPLLVSKVEPYIAHRRVEQSAYARHAVALAARYP